MEETLAEFRRFDLTGCGSMAREILAGVLRECTELSNEAIDALIDTVDTEGTGRIKYEQFVVWLWGREEPPEKERLLADAAEPEPPKEAAGAAGGASPEGAAGGAGAVSPAEAPGAAEDPLLDVSRSNCQDSALDVTASTCQPDLDVSSATCVTQAGAGGSRAATPATPSDAAPARQSEGQICRYCLDSGNAEDLVSPCACRGSSSSVHVQCLLSYAKQQQQEMVGIDVTCPTCKTPYMGTAALRLLPLALEDVKRRHGAKHVAVARVLKTMAGNHLSLMQFEEAKQCIEAATEMHRSLQDAPFDVAGEPIDMAEVLAIRIMIDQGMCAILQDAKWDARASAETVAQVESILDEHYKHECGPDAPRVAGVLMSLCLGDNERPVRQRIKMLQRALGLLEGYYGKDRADEYANTLNVLTTMAILAGEVGDFKTVERLSQRAIVVQRRHSGPAHPTTLMSCCLLVCAQLKMGEIGEARTLLDQVISVAEQTEFMPALAPAMRVVRARLLGELGDVAEMRRECLRIVEEANSRCDLYTKLKGPEPACTLREAEAAMGRDARDVAGACPEAHERSHDSPGSDWEDQLRDLAVRFVLGDRAEATVCARASVRELQAALGVDAIRVMSASIAYVRRFWERNLAGALKADLEAWFDSLAEHAAALAYARRLASRAAARALGGRLGSECLRFLGELEAEDGVQYGATRADAFAAGDAVCSLISMASLPGWALHESDQGVVEAPGPLHGCASIRFSSGAAVLPLTDVCRPCNLAERLRERGLPCRGLVPGQRVRSLVSAACHPRALARGLEGVVTALDRTRGRANVDFGGAGPDGAGPRLRVTLLLSDVCAADEFQQRLEARRAASGGFFVGETVRSLIFLPLQAPRPLLFGAEGAVAMLDAQHRRVLVRFGGDEGLQVLVRFQDVSLPEDFEARVQERRAVLAGLMPGDHVRSLVSCQDWVPRPLREGEEGTILMINPVTNRALVDFAGEETLRGEMDPHSVCPAAEFEVRILEAGAGTASGPGRPSSVG